MGTIMLQTYHSQQSLKLYSEANFSNSNYPVKAFSLQKFQSVSSMNCLLAGQSHQPDRHARDVCEFGQWT